MKSVKVSNISSEKRCFFEKYIDNLTWWNINWKTEIKVSWSNQAIHAMKDQVK